MTVHTIRQTLRVNLCVGCGVCAAACGAKAIEMRWRNGMPIPSINRGKCAKCGLCAKVCVHTPERIRKEAEDIASEQDAGVVGLTDAKFFLAWEKENEPDANNFNAHAYSAEGTLFRENRFRSGWTDAWRNYLFALSVCCYCSDFWGRDADISVKDASGPWADDQLGKSIVIVRGVTLKEFIRKTGLELEPLDLETVQNCQSAKSDFQTEAGARQMDQVGKVACKPTERAPCPLMPCTNVAPALRGLTVSYREATI